MSPIASYLLSIVIGIVAGGLFAGYHAGAAFSLDLATCGAFAAVALAGALVNQVLVASRAAAVARTAGTATATTTATASPQKPSTKPTASGPANNTPREQGLVKWFNYTKGFGFITRDSGDDIFVHFKSIRGEGNTKRGLRDGQRVEFNVTKGDKGLQAEDVVVLS